MGGDDASSQAWDSLMAPAPIEDSDRDAAELSVPIAVADHLDMGPGWTSDGNPLGDSQPSGESLWIASPSKNSAVSSREAAGAGERRQHEVSLAETQVCRAMIASTCFC